MLQKDLGHDPARGLDPRQVIDLLDRLIPQDRVVVTDSGRHFIPLPTLLAARDGRSWLQSRGHGSVGLGIGAAVGAAVAAPDRPVVLVCGDGGFMMGLQGLDCLRLNDLSLTIVVMNDEQWGAEVGILRRYGLPVDVIRQTLPDIPYLAQSFGGHGYVVRTIDQLLQIDFESPGLQVVDVRIDPEMIAFSRSDDP